MKKIFTIASVFALGLVITFACKKSTTTTTPTTTSTSSTTGANANVTTLTVDGNSIGSMTTTPGANSTEYLIDASCTTTASSGYPFVDLTFPGTAAPTAGTYTISTLSFSTMPAAGHCYLQYNPSFSGSGSYVASTGFVTITAGTPNTASFSNVVCTNSVGSHTVTAALKY
jgi:hypothetical protein